MAFLSPNPQTYITQWLETATNGGVVGEFSLSNNRMRLRCLKCGMSHMSPKPEGTTIDFSIQEFVKLHAHKGPSWTCGNCGEETAKSLTEHSKYCKPTNDMKWKDGKLIPVTADFKPIQSGGKIDLNPEKEAKIKAVSDSISKEYAEQMESVVAKQKAIENAMKIKLLQAQLSDLQKTTVHVHVGKPPVLPTEPKTDSVMVTGRKFR